MGNTDDDLAEARAMIRAAALRALHARDMTFAEAEPAVERLIDAARDRATVIRAELLAETVEHAIVNLGLSSDGAIEFAMKALYHPCDFDRPND